jgi:hypothetical protein
VTPLPFLTAEEMITGIPNPNARAAYNPGPAETVTTVIVEVRKNVLIYMVLLIVYRGYSNKCLRASAICNM